MGRPPTTATSRLPAFLSAERPFHEHAVVAGELDGAGVAHEVGGVQEVDMERVALDPLAAVQQPTQGSDGRGPRSMPAASSKAWTALIW